MKTECKSELPADNKNCSVMKADTSFDEKHAVHSPKTGSRRLSSTPRAIRNRIPSSLPKSPRTYRMHRSSTTHAINKQIPQETLSSLREGRRIAKLRNRSGRSLRVRMSRANRKKSETIQEKINQLNRMITLKKIKKGKCRDETEQNNYDQGNDNPETNKASTCSEHSLWDRIVGGICLSDDNIMTSSSDIEKLEEGWIEKLGQKVESKLHIGCGTGEREVEELQYSFDASSGILSCPSSSSSQDYNGSLVSTTIDNGSFTEIKDESHVLQRAKNKMSAKESSKSQSVSKSCANIRDQSRNLKRNTGLKISTKPEIRETTEHSIDEVRDSHESNEKYGTHKKYELSEGYFTRNTKPEIRETAEHFIDEVGGSRESSIEKYGAHEKYELSEEFTKNSRSSAEVFLKPEIGHNSPVGKNIDGVHYRLPKGLPQPKFIKCKEKKRGSKSQLCVDSLDKLRKLHARDARELQESKVINSYSR